MSREKLKEIISEFSIENFISFFRNKSDKFVEYNTMEYQYNDDTFTDATYLGDIEFSDEKLIIYAFKVNKDINERAGKKEQYDKAKQVLKDHLADAGIFIFYDGSQRFRFSLIVAEYKGTKREFSSYKRYTYFVSKDQTNKTFIQRIGDADFSSIDTIKEAFSVDKLTKEFYQELANWYFWALKEARFTSDVENQPGGRNIALIRLITRLMFIWFMRQKAVVNRELFDIEFLESILKDISPESRSYYLAILQNLFFATLNTPIQQRNSTSFKHHNLFEDADKIEHLFKDIPYLNGGLFECLDEIDDEGREIYLDGFSDDPEKQPYLPNYLFFSEGREVDLSEYYGTKNRKVVRGIINILSSYNFTIDENSPVDEEVALDPELLGKVFENLLASYNPETATTARKMSGSYYTPREIVDYMVKESLKEYFKVKIPNIDQAKLEELFSYHKDINPFDEETTNKLIEAINDVKIIDPAVGSGAFPMGTLHALVHILGKLDPENKKWKEEQIKIANNIKDPKVRNEVLQKIEESFTFNELDYGRKLYLIQNCIYGVDIQPIAIQIAKLRFFISLLVDQKIDASKPNYGIEPLPNLETKLVAADTLIKPNIQSLPQRLDELKEIKQKIFNLRQEYFNTQDKQRKSTIRTLDKKYRKEMQGIIENYIKKKHQIKEDLKRELQAVPKEKDIITVEVKELFETKTVNIDKNELKRKEIQSKINQIESEIRDYYKPMLDGIQKVIEWDPYDTNRSASWFSLDWMFGVSDGFDIVIGNPPYVQLQANGGKLANKYKDQKYETFSRTGDIYVLFYEEGIDLLKEGGILCYITSNKWMRSGYGEKLREFLIKFNPILLIDLGSGVFESATVDTNILIVQKAKNQNNLKALTFSRNSNQTIEEQVKQNSVIITKLTKDGWFIGSTAEQKLKEKIERIGKPLRYWDVKIYYGIKTGLNKAFIITTEKRDEILANCKDEEERELTEDIISPILRGRDIKRYYYKWAGLWMIIIPSGWTRTQLLLTETLTEEEAEERVIKLIPSLMSHLLPFKEEARKRRSKGNYWWELPQGNLKSTYYNEFEKEKVVYSEIVRRPQFHFDTEKFYVEATSFLMTGKDVKYICGLLNSNPVAYFFKKWYAGGGLGEVGYRYKKAFLENLPIPPITPQNKNIVKQIEALADKILQIKKHYPDEDTSHLEREIDKLVYKLYDLTEEEIKIVIWRC